MDIIQIINLAESLYVKYGYEMVFLSSFIEITPLGFTVPGGTILAVGGFFAYGSKVNLIGIILAGWLGSWFTFILAYILGKKTGHWLVRKLKQEKNAERAKTMLENHGGVILTTSMLANLTRFWVAYVAGEERYNLAKFILYSGVAALTWTSILVTLGYLAGSERAQLEKTFTRLGIFSWLLVILAVGIIIYLNKKYSKTHEDSK